MNNKQALTRIHALDGLRGVAVLLVLLFHAQVPGFAGGFIGVHIFFVLSGFLITRILITDLDNKGRIDLVLFYQQRAYRILPPLGLALTGYVTFAIWHGDVEKIVNEVGPAIFFVTNLVRSANYSFPIYFGHTWSLSTEEQFYLVCPIALAFTYRKIGRTNTAFLMLMILSIAMLCRAIIAKNGYDGLVRYVCTIFECDGLLLGALIAFAETESRSSRWQEALSWIGKGWPVAIAALAAIAVKQSGLSYGLQAYGHSVIYVCVAIVICNLVSSRQSMISKILCINIIRQVGRISYGLYLYHWPLFTAFFFLGASNMRVSVGIPLSIILASASFLLIERPLMHFGRGIVHQRLGHNRSSGYSILVSSETAQI